MVAVKVGEEKEGFVSRADGRTVVLSEGIDEDGGIGDLVNGNVLVHPCGLVVEVPLRLLLLLLLVWWEAPSYCLDPLHATREPPAARHKKTCTICLCGKGRGE